MKPGIYKDLDINAYHASAGLSSSSIRLLLKDPKKYWYKYLSGKAKADKASDDQIFGNAVHTAILEPSAFEQRYFMTSKITRSGEKWAKVLAEAGSRQVLFNEDYAAIQEILRSVAEIQVARQVLENGNAEHSIYWNDASGVLCKARPDFFNDKCVIEVKTTKDASYAEFSKSIKDYGYHVQAAMQVDAIEAVTGNRPLYFIFLAVEKEAPFKVRDYLLRERDIEQGRRLYKQAIATYEECLKANKWPAQTKQLEEIGVPTWALDEDLREVDYV